MSSTTGFSTQILLNKKLSHDDIQKCLTLFLTDEFLAYNYGKNSYESFESILKEYPNETTFSLKYKNVVFVLTSAGGKDYLLINMNNVKDSEIILTLTDSLCTTVSEKFLFSLIDKEGDSPRDFDSSINKLEIKWLFKYNYFGKDFIEKYGKDFFTNMPCIKQEFVTDNIIRIDLCKNIFSPIDKSLIKEVSEYLNGFSIDVNFYNYKDFLID